MSRERQREAEDETSADESNDSRRLGVSDRTSWSGLTKRAYNVVRSNQSATTGEQLQLGGAMVLGAILASLIPLPFTWLVGLAAGGAVGGRTAIGSPTTAGVAGGLIGLVFGVTFVTALFGLGSVVTLLLAVVGAAVGLAGYLAVE